MKLIPRLLWKSLSRRQREQLLFLLPDHDRQACTKIITGSRLYQGSFDCYRCIFVHIPKCAGTSVSRGLFGQDTVGHIPIYWHQMHNPVRFEEYFKFGFVRNPWDRLVSAYLYLQRGGASKRDREWSRFVQGFASFDDFVCRWLSPENVERGLLFLPQHRFLSDRFGMPCLDYLGRFENLAEDFVRVAACLSLRVRLPLSNRTPDRRPYSDYYTAESRQRVAQVYARDIEWFGYRFDGGWEPTALIPARQEGL